MFVVYTQKKEEVKHSRGLGFTLAEILITLGIIGIVAAMTIPTLVANYNKSAWDTGATVFNRKLEEALKTMNTQQTLAGHTTTESFVEELSKHFKTNKICSNDKLLDCFSETVYWGSGDATPEEVDMSVIKTSKYFGQKEWNTNIVGVQFANGTNALIAYNPLTSGNKTCSQDPHSNQITGDDCLAILYDTSGKKNPNSLGKDLRANSNVTRLNSGCALEIGSACYATISFVPNPIGKAECEAIKSTHGIKTCNYDKDYWAGAVKACGHVNKMLTGSQLGKLAGYVYNINALGTGSKYSLSMDTTKSNELGISTTDFYIWAREEEDNGYGYARYFAYNGTNYGSRHRNHSSYYVICLED